MVISATHISLVLGEALVRDLFPILQQGFDIRATVPCTIRGLLCDQLGLDLTYVSERITTIFLNGKPTDSMEELVGDGATIALSAAMPGVVGATMRRGSYYASMRSAITFMDKDKAEPHGKGMIRLKLFNLLLDDLGLEMLVRGIIISPTLLEEFIHKAPALFWEQCDGAFIDGIPVAPILLKQLDSFAGNGSIELSVVVKEKQ